MAGKTMPMTFHKTYLGATDNGHLTAAPAR